VVTNLAQANGIGRGLVAAHQLPSLAGVVVCAKAGDFVALPQELGLEAEV
jgi:hypothetical protein